MVILSYVQNSSLGGVLVAVVSRLAMVTLRHCKRRMLAYNSIISSRSLPRAFEPRMVMRKFDIIVCATGFDVSFLPYWNVVGRNGIKLGDKWADNPMNDTPAETRKNVRFKLQQ